MSAVSAIARHRGVLALATFFGLKVVLALALLKLSAMQLDAPGFVLFSQFLMFSALLNLVGSGGVQNGLVRQIASAAEDPERARTAFRAALQIWGAVSLLAVPVVLARAPLSILLTGDEGGAWIVPWIAGAAVLNGFGQLLNAVLIGSRRLAANAASQGLGLAVGTAGSAFFLFRGEPGWAVIAFAVGSLVAVPASRLLSHGLDAISRGVIGDLREERRWLLAYSGAFVLAASLTPTVLFGLRFAYREAFGAEALGDWLVANRVSDVSTQLLGLFMAQWFLPHLARLPTGRPALRLAALAFAVGTGTMLLFATAFALGASVWIPLFISPEFLSAAGFIGAYMVGDALRVSASIALHGALARRRLWTYVAVEASAAGLMAILCLSFIWLGDRTAPLWGYLGGYGVLAVLMIGLFARSTLRIGREEVVR